MEPLQRNLRAGYASRPPATAAIPAARCVWPLWIRLHKSDLLSCSSLIPKPNFLPVGNWGRGRWARPSGRGQKERCLFSTTEAAICMKTKKTMTRCRRNKRTSTTVQPQLSDIFDCAVPRVMPTGRQISPDSQRAFCCSIHLSVRASSMSSGRVPPSRISSWKARISNFGPSSFWARVRSSRIFSWPSL